MKGFPRLAEFKRVGGAGGIADVATYLRHSCCGVYRFYFLRDLCAVSGFPEILIMLGQWGRAIPIFSIINRLVV